MDEEDLHQSMQQQQEDLYPYLMDGFDVGMHSPLYNQDPADLGPQSRNASPERSIDVYPTIENTCVGGKAGLPVFKKAVQKNRSAYNLFIKDRVAWELGLVLEKTLFEAQTQKYQRSDANSDQRMA